MKAMLQHSFVLDALETTAADTFTHFEMLVEDHRRFISQQADLGDCGIAAGTAPSSQLKQLVPTIGVFHTALPLRSAFLVYNEKHRLTKRKHIQISFNELRHILNLAQIMALRKVQEPPSDAVLSSAHSGLLRESEACADDNPNDLSSQLSSFNGPRLISFDGDQTLYSDGENFERNPQLAHYLYQLMRHGVHVAVVTAAGYEYEVEKYEYRLSGLLHYFQKRGLSPEECERFYLFGGECNYLLRLGADYRLQRVREHGPGGWMTSTQHLNESPANWSTESVRELLDTAQGQIEHTLKDLNLRGKVIRKYRSVGLVPRPCQEIPRESLDETVLRVKEDLNRLNGCNGPNLPYCAFNGGSDMWLDVGNKRVGVQILQSYLGIPAVETLHIGDQFLNTGNDYAARDVSPCIWIINPQETTYILKSILRLAGVAVTLQGHNDNDDDDDEKSNGELKSGSEHCIDVKGMEARSQAAKRMDVYTGEMMAGADAGPSGDETKN